MAVLDFSKAFDTVPHNRLLHKLRHYGIKGNTWKWISAFLKQRSQRVVVDGKHSQWTSVDSGVPQGTVMGPLLFLLHINDLPKCVTSQVRLFADDCLIYRAIKSVEDQIDFQKDLDELQKWAEKWGMRFNASKCQIMRIHRGNTPLNRFYSINNTILSQVDKAKYLGVTITEDLNWSTHVNNVVTKATKTLGFIRRNLGNCPQNLREMAYFSLVRSQLEYASVAWDPHQNIDITHLEKVQRKAARFVKQDYSRYSSVSKMIQELEWKELEQRRKDIRLTMLYKIVHEIVHIPKEGILIPADKRTRSEHEYKYRVPIQETNEYKHSFFPKTIPQWNCLPKALTRSDTVDAFKHGLKDIKI